MTTMNATIETDARTEAEVQLDAEAEAKGNATAENAAWLLRSYRLLTLRHKACVKAAKAVDEGWLDGGIEDLREERDVARSQYDKALDAVWNVLGSMPRGTVAPGGMTPQTIGLEFFNRNLNRDGGRRLSANQARKINQASASYIR